MWFNFALFFAFWTSISMLISKKLLRNVNPFLYFSITLIFTLPFLIILLILMGIPSFSKEFFKLILICAGIDLCAGVLYYKSLSISEISLLAPISSFNPIFTLIFAWILIGEKPTPIKLAGIIIIVFGSYLLNIKDIKDGLFKPFTNLFSNKGVQIFLIVNLLWGLTPIFQKNAIFQTTPNTPISVPVIEVMILLIFLMPIWAKNSKKVKTFGKTNLKLLIFFGVFGTLAQFAAFSAFSLTNVAYATAVFKLSTLFSVIIGAIFLKEDRIQERFLGASVMVVGTILILI